MTDHGGHGGDGGSTWFGPVSSVSSVVTLLSRIVAIAIAVAAFVDPSLTLTGRARPRIALVQEAPGIEEARVAHQRVSDSLRHDFDVEPGRDETADAVVMVGTEYPREPIAERQRAYTVTVASRSGEPDVRIAAARTPHEVPSGTLIHAEVDVDAFYVGGATTTLTVRTGPTNVEVARAVHAWTGGARQRWTAAIDVVPVDRPPWHLHIAVSGAAGERQLADNHADVMVDAAAPLGVLVYEPRPSWASTFVRRALERDPRFEVGSVSYPSRGVGVTMGDGTPLGALSLERARAIVVGGLDRLTRDEASILGRFMREREGAVVLVPDSLADLRAAARWLPIPPATEVLLEQPRDLAVDAPLPAVAASELLTFDPRPEHHVLARRPAESSPVVLIEPVGPGRLLISGALDAWRFRATDGSSADRSGAFDRFWTALIAGVALASPPPIDIDVDPAIVAPGAQATVRVRVRRAALGRTKDDELWVSSTLGTGDVVRLWPDRAADSFQGSFTAPSNPGGAFLSVGVSYGATATARFMIAPQARAAHDVAPPLSLVAETHGGIDVTPTDIPFLVARLREEIAGGPVTRDRYPMRSVWWIVPFVACLSVEWWLRRRAGLR